MKKNKSVIFSNQISYDSNLCGAYGSFCLKTTSTLKLHHIYNTCFLFFIPRGFYCEWNLCLFWSDSCTDFFLRWEMYFILTPFTPVVLLVIVHFYWILSSRLAFVGSRAWNLLPDRMWPLLLLLQTDVEGAFYTARYWDLIHKTGLLVIRSLLHHVIFLMEH